MTQQITPERALELANKIEGRELYVSTWLGTAATVVDEELIAILRWAAEIMQAPDVGYVERNKCAVGAILWTGADVADQELLIIKPALPATGDK